MGRLYASIGMALLLCACGGSKKKDSDGPDDGYVYGQEEEHEESEELIPAEKFDIIKATFERKASTVARCFPEAVTAGELGSEDRVKVTLGLVIQPDGSATQLRIVGASKRSKTLEACVIKSVSRWQFTTLPKSLEYSYAFVMQRF
jgi:hypothetical protein